MNLWLIALLLFVIGVYVFVSIAVGGKKLKKRELAEPKTAKEALKMIANGLMSFSKGAGLLFLFVVVVVAQGVRKLIEPKKVKR
jgi:hypothetical protein